MGNLGAEHDRIGRHRGGAHAESVERGALEESRPRPGRACAYPRAGDCLARRCRAPTGKAGAQRGSFNPNFFILRQRVVGLIPSFIAARLLFQLVSSSVCRISLLSASTIERDAPRSTWFFSICPRSPMSILSDLLRMTAPLRVFSSSRILPGQSYVFNLSSACAVIPLTLRWYFDPNFVMKCITSSGRSLILSRNGGNRKLMSLSLKERASRNLFGLIRFDKFSFVLDNTRVST